MTDFPDFKYHTAAELAPYVGQEVEFMGFCTKPERRVLQKEVTKNSVSYWLPFCGLVNATTVKTRFPKNTTS